MLVTDAVVDSLRVRRKVKTVDAENCYILGHVMKMCPPDGQNWEDNDGLRPLSTPPLCGDQSRTSLKWRRHIPRCT